MSVHYLPTGVYMLSAKSQKYKRFRSTAATYSNWLKASAGMHPVHVTHLLPDEAPAKATNALDDRLD